MGVPVEMHVMADRTVASAAETPTLQRLEQLEAKLDSQMRRWDGHALAQVAPLPSR